MLIICTIVRTGKGPDQFSESVKGPGQFSESINSLRAKVESELKLTIIAVSLYIEVISI